MKTFDQWKELTLGATRGLTDEQVDAIAARLVAATKPDGTISSVWHELHLELQTPKCHCRRCNG